MAQVERDVAAAPEQTPALESAARNAERVRAAADAALEAAAARVAAGEAEARAARARLEEAQARLSRLSLALSHAETERRALGPTVTPEFEKAENALAAATAALSLARSELDAAEHRRAEGARAESAARQAARTAEDELARTAVEALGLARLTTSAARGPYSIALDAVTAEGGLEGALAAALGDELTAALDPRALSFWAGREASAPVWPEGVTPLAAAVRAPPQLAARLAFVGLVDAADGARRQSSLPPGCRMVSREGDLWRWDGFTIKAAAPRPSQVRLEQKTRLAALEAEVARSGPRAARAKAAHDKAAVDLASAERDLRLARDRPRTVEAELAGARDAVERLRREAARREARGQALDEAVARLAGEKAEAQSAMAAAAVAATLPSGDPKAAGLPGYRAAAAAARDAAAEARAAHDRETAVRGGRLRRLEALRRDHAEWTRRGETARSRQGQLQAEREKTVASLTEAARAPETVEARRGLLVDELSAAERRRGDASDALAVAEARRTDGDRAARAADAIAADAREALAGSGARLEGAVARLDDQTRAVLDATGLAPEDLGRRLTEKALGLPEEPGGAETLLAALERERDALGGVNLLAEEEMSEVTARLGSMAAERADLSGALNRLNQAIEELNAEGRERLTAAFEIIDRHFRDLFTTLFQGGAAELRLVESEDPLEAGLEILACPPGKRMAVMSLMSGGEQALTAVALIFAVFLANPAPICVLDEVDAPLDDANVSRFCDLLGEMRRRAPTRFLTITHNPLTMSRMDRLYGVTMRERGVSQLVSVDLRQAEALAAH